MSWALLFRLIRKNGKAADDAGLQLFAMKHVLRLLVVKQASNIDKKLPSAGAIKYLLENTTNTNVINDKRNEEHLC